MAYWTARVASTLSLSLLLCQVLCYLVEAGNLDISVIFIYMLHMWVFYLERILELQKCKVFPFLLSLLWLADVT